jgi:hypothetical protein
MVKKYIQYSEEIAEEICTEIATSTSGLEKLCKQNPHWPVRANIYKWCYMHPHFRDKYAQAKAMQVDWLAEEALEIAYNGSKDTYIDEKNKERCDHEWVNRSRLKVDTIKWYASKLAPKIYNDRGITQNDINDAISQFRVEDK